MLTLCALGLVSVQGARYNILSLDSAKYKGYMTASFVSFMEQYAYSVAERDYCIPARESKRIAMHELFDMVAGSETGAIIATTISLPNDNSTTKATQANKYFADTAVNWFAENVDTLYRDQQMPIWFRIIIELIFMSLFGFVAYWFTNWLLHIDHFEQHIKDLRCIIRMRKKENRKDMVTEDEENEMKGAIENIHELANKAMKSGPHSLSGQQCKRLTKIFH